MRGPVRIAITLIWISFGMVGASTPASSALRIDTGAVIEADAETVVRIEEVFNRAEDAIAEKNLDALMAVYSEHYHDQDRSKAEMRTIWKRFFERYERIDTPHTFSRIIVTPENPPTADITCTGALWATVGGTDQRVNLSLCAGQGRTVPWPWPEHGGAKGGVHSNPSYWDGPSAWIIVSCVTEGLHMTNEDKQRRILPWIDPEERVTVRFLDVSDLNATVTDCTDQLVDLSIETSVAYMNQHLSIPLRQVEVSDDVSHYTRDPERPLQRHRLMLVINEKRPAIIY